MPTIDIPRSLTNVELFTRQGELMRDKPFLIEVASACDQSYRDSEINRINKANETAEVQQPIADYLKNSLFSTEEKDVLVSGPQEGNLEQQKMYDKAQQKLAMNLAGFYALSEGLGMIAEENPTDQHAASKLLDSIVNKTADQKNLNKMCRLAHATWAAGQPYRNRETRKVMQPWDTLPEGEKLKDMVQITAAAVVLERRTSKP